MSDEEKDPPQEISTAAFRELLEHRAIVAIDPSMILRLIDGGEDLMVTGVSAHPITRTIEVHVASPDLPKVDPMMESRRLDLTMTIEQREIDGEVWSKYRISLPEA